MKMKANFPSWKTRFFTPRKMNEAHFRRKEFLRWNELPLIRKTDSLFFFCSRRVLNPNQTWPRSIAWPRIDKWPRRPKKKPQRSGRGWMRIRMSTQGSLPSFFLSFFLSYFSNANLNRKNVRRRNGFSSKWMWKIENSAKKSHSQLWNNVTFPYPDFS